MQDRAKAHHVHQVVESELETDVDHVVRVGGGEDVVALGVVPEQVHGELDRELWEEEECLYLPSHLYFVGRCPSSCSPGNHCQFELYRLGPPQLMEL